MASPKAVSSFDQLELDTKISKAITACGYESPTPIQAQSIPPILEQKDLIACAQTGSGKTASFVLPALQLLCDQPPSKKTRILILTPTRELANQITKAVSTYGKFMKLNTAVLVGGMPYHHQIKDLARGADIIVATPGRLLDHLEQRRVDLSGIEMLVLDEADRMLDMGFIDDVQYIAKLTPTSRQTLLFSATIGKELANVVRHLMKHPVRIDLSDEKISTPKIRQELYKVSGAQHKNKLLKHFLLEGNIYKAIIFSATKINADKLAQHLRDDGFSAGSLHGDLRQNVRNRTIEQLRNGKIQFLVATDVAARGIDIRDITHVINYDLPRFSEDYVHRIGRTGRAGKEGVAISFVGPTDNQHLQRIERYTGQRIKLMPDVTINNEAIKRVEGSGRTEESGRSVLSIEKVHRFDKDTNKKRKKNAGSENRRFRSSDEQDKRRKPGRKFGDKPHYGEKRSSSEPRRPAHKFGDKPHYSEKRSSSDSRKPSRKFDDNPRYSERRSSSDSRKPAHKFDDKPRYSEKRSSSDDRSPAHARSEGWRGKKGPKDRQAKHASSEHRSSPFKKEENWRDKKRKTKRFERRSIEERT